MKILMINPTHPQIAHISAVRAWRLSQELAVLGHQVVLLTGTMEGEPASNRSLATHAWLQPLVLACPGGSAAATNRRPLPAWIRRARTALCMLRHGGEDARWVDSAVLAGTSLAPSFVPDVIWTTFGKLEAVVAAKRIASRLRKPWVLDVKDNWELFVPRGLRSLMARRVRGWRAVTCNAILCKNLSQKWLGADATLVYSGVEDCFLARGDDLVNARFEINLIGGVYFEQSLTMLLAGIAAWFETLPTEQRSRVVFRYLGGQSELVSAAASLVLPGIARELPGYVSAATMARLCQNAAANTYVAHPGTFHHKLLELLACGRQVIAVPSESPESLELAEPQHKQLQVAATGAQVAAVLGRISAEYFTTNSFLPLWSSDHIACYSWSNQAMKLQEVLASAATA